MFSYQAKYRYRLGLYPLIWQVLTQTNQSLYWRGREERGPTWRRKRNQRVGRWAASSWWWWGAFWCVSSVNGWPTTVSPPMWCFSAPTHWIWRVPQQQLFRWSSPASVFIFIWHLLISSKYWVECIIHRERLHNLLLLLFKKFCWRAWDFCFRDWVG